MKIKRNVLSMAIATALAGSSSVALAATMGWGALYDGGTEMFTDYDSEATIAAELLLGSDDATRTMSTSIGGGIGWKPGYALNEGDLVTLTFSGALYMGADATLCSGATALLSNFGTLDSTNGVSTVTLRASTDASGFNGPMMLDEGPCDVTYPDLLIDSGLGAGSSVSMTSTATNVAAVNIPAGSGSNDLFDVAKQLSVSVVQKASSVADVTAVDPDTGDSAPRTAFVDETGGDPTLIAGSDYDTSLLMSGATIRISNASDSGVTNQVEIAHSFASGDNLYIDFIPSSDLTSVSSVAGETVFDNDLTTEYGGDYSYSTSSSPTDLTHDTTEGKLRLTIPGTFLNMMGPGVLTDDVIITTDGGTIDEREWTMKSTLDLAAEGEQAYGELTSHSWTTNGTVLRAPFFTLVEGYVPRLYLTNDSDAAVDYIIDIISDPAASTPLSFISGNDVETGTIDANSSLLLKMPDLVQGKRGGLIITLTGACSTVTGVFQQRYGVTGDFTHYNLVPSTSCIPTSALD